MSEKYLNEMLKKARLRLIITVISLILSLSFTGLVIYIMAHFIDKEYGGAYRSLNSKGEPSDTRKQTYTISFFIYGILFFFFIFCITIPNEIFIILIVL